MAECKLDHSQEDVQKKLAEQSSFLPNALVEGLKDTLNTQLTQEKLNELFHLLKKYDLAAPEERANRDEQLRQFIPR
ncbi:50S ribosomal protein L7ae [Brevibacillus migulae]|uniref:50S ribosomal protein L7ae n=1 Tax=Brevibacillus migulae TaxID=1644114 RepID=UPI00106F0168|nr:50S ribosomal protein L7ae [Brevibacillus migulae]